MISFKLLLLVLGLVRISYARPEIGDEDERVPKEEPEGEPEEEPEEDTPDEQEPGEETEEEPDTKSELQPEPHPEPQPETQLKPQPEPQPVPQPDPDCNIYYRNYEWALQDCVCRPFQNDCLMKIENAKRINSGNKPFVPVTEELCQSFIPPKCSKGRRVVAQFPIPAPCGCNRKPGSIATVQFPSLCHLLKFSAENKKPFLSYSYI